MRIALITAGGAGMFCGSCMHDNTWVRALRDAGADACLIPLYTPIRVDEEDASLDRVFFGGVNVYLNSRWRLWDRVPRSWRRWLDRPRLLEWATRFAVSNDAHRLGRITISMLQGESGPHGEQTAELVDFLTNHVQPDVVVFSNSLLVGALQHLKASFRGQVYCILQGDDVFLEALVEPYQSRAIELIQQQAASFDGFLVHSRYYRDFMSGYLGLPKDKFHLLPLGIDLKGHDGQPVLSSNDRFTIGYFARVCPEKGLDQLVEAFKILHAEAPNSRLLAGGYLARRDRKYLRRIQREAACLGDAFRYVGSPEWLGEKVAFLKSLDVFSVPTVYREPKGLYALEAMANGVPVVLPCHGAFPELIEATGGGLLIEPGDPEQLAGALQQLMSDPSRRLELARAGRAGVRRRYDPQTMAEETIRVLGEAGGGMRDTGYGIREAGGGRRNAGSEI